MSQNIKNNLFRFVTLRSPQLIDEKDKKLGFVYHPDEVSGSFFTPLNAATEEQKKKALLDAKDSFEESQSVLKKRADVKALNDKLYQFSSWLMRNKNTLSYAEILDNINGAQELSNNDLLKVWDNLIYQTLSKSSVYVREALIQMLVANKFLAHFNTFSRGLSGIITFTEDQEKEFVRCANASVVIAKSLLLETYNTKVANTRSRGNNNKNQKRLSDLLTAKYHLSIYKKLETELKLSKKSYDETERQAYKRALDSHQIAVDAIIAQGKNELVDQWSVEKQIYEKVEQFVHDPLPKFEYQKSTEIDIKVLETKLSPLTYRALTTNNLDTLSSYAAIFREIKALKTSKINEIDKLLPKQSKSVLKNGVSMKIEDPFNEILESFGDTDAQIEELVDAEFSENNIPNLVASEIINSDINSDSCYTVKLVANASGKDKDDNRDWSFSLGVKSLSQLNTNVVAINYTLSFPNDNTTYTSTSFNTYGADSNSSRIHLFTDIDHIEIADIAGNPTLTGVITLASGETLDFSETIIMFLNNSRLFGSKFVDYSCKDEVPSDESSTKFDKIYGVTNLGIADFRRVEQEVCCYVPGEVSHIENVMAREYKERSTRSLTSSELTTEKTDERERENLTDTTSTERNEMQSEVASVLNEDQSESYGGNASVSGKISDKFQYAVGAYFDNASSSSTSNSNTQAQTYAQEVTERAMERIVQKTQTKRTSRILKEFEENNSHGFDNRKGENHVTGVYRWVDKIYKNKLINYGKRLMYEFAIPEPSKFFQEAVWKQLDTTGQVESGIILPEMPVHPSEFINSVDYINASNYLQLADAYGIVLPKYPESEKFIGKAFGFSAQEVRSDNHERYGEGAELDIPEGYYAVQATAEWTHSRDTYLSKPVKAIVGNKKIIANGTYQDVDKFMGKIPISYSAHTVLSGSVNFSVKLLRTDEYLDMWQNEVYNLAYEAYEEKLNEYNEIMQANNIIPSESTKKLTFNPLQNKSIMLRELKRVAIELLIDKTRISKNNFNEINETTRVSEVKKDEAFQTHAATVKFFEQAFDWDIMAYVFYPYFYADEQDWKKLFQLQDAADPLFQAFLQSGMARTVVPVRPGFEYAVNWYMTTGEIWNGQGLVVDQDDDLYVSIAEDMQTIKGEVEGTWETRLPTALTILQAGSIGLNVEGLPCNEDCSKKLFDTDDNPIAQTGNLIGGADGVGSDTVSQPITVQ